MVWKDLVKTTSIRTFHRITIENSVYEDGIFKSVPKFEHIATDWIGGFPTKNCEFEIYNRNNDIDILNKEVILERGHLNNGQIKWFKIGYFKILKTVNNKTTQSIKCKGKDRSIKFQEKYESELNWENPHTGEEIIKEICDKLGVLIEGTFGFANYVFTKINFEANTSYREVVSRMAELGGEIAFINSRGNLIFKPQTEKEIIIEKKHRIKYSLEKPKEKIGRLAIGFKGYDDDFIIGENTDGDFTYRIENNPYADLIRADIAPFIFEKIKGKQIVDFRIVGSITSIFIELNDTITLIGNDGVANKVTVLSIKDNGTFRTEISCLAENNNKANYLIAGSTKQQLEQAKFEVNHMKKEISGMITKIEENSSLSAIFKQTLENISSKVEQQIKDNAKEFTQLKQDFQNFLYEIQTTGKDNLIFDSAFYSFTDYKEYESYKNIEEKEFCKWYAEYSNDETHKLEGIVINNSVSGYGIKLINNILYQKIRLKSQSEANNMYSLSFKMKKGLVGNVSIKLKNEMNEELLKYEIISGEGTESKFKKESIEELNIPQGDYILEIKSENNAEIELTDLILNIGVRASQWNQAIGEVRNINTSIGQEGLSIQGKNTNNITKITPSEVVNYNIKNGTLEKVFGISGDISEMSKLNIFKEIEMKPFKIISINETNKKGWALIIQE